MSDFGKVSAEKAQAIIQALKDGKINPEEMKQLGLTAKEAEELNKAFSSGEVQIGDFVLVNKGKVVKNGKTMQLSETKQAPAEEPGFLEKAGNFVARNGKKYAENFSSAWNNNSGFFGTAVALLGATTKTVTEVVKDVAEAQQKAAEYATGSETVGKMAKYANGVGVVAGGIEALEKFGDWSAEKIRAHAEKYSGKEREDLMAFADKVEGMDAMQIAAMLAAGVAVSPLLALTSCQEDTQIYDESKDFNISVKETFDIKIQNAVNMEELLAILREMKDKQESMDAHLADIYLKMDKFGNDLSQIIAQLSKFGVSLEQLLDAVGNLGDILQQIAVNQGVQQKTLDEISQDNKDIKELLKQIIIAINKNTDVTVQKADEIIAAIKELGNSTTAGFAAVIEAINQGGGGETGAKELLEKLLAAVKENTAKDKENTKAILEAIGKLGADVVTAINNLGIDVGDKLNAILNAIGNDSQKLDDLKKLLADINKNVVNYGEDGKKLGEAILEAIKNLGANQKDIIKFLQNINNGVDQGNVNLDKIIKLLENLDKKADQINVKADAMVKGINDILEALKKGLKDIEVKIEDHDVHVTVDVTGKVTCECNCGKPNEGIIDELNAIFN